MTNAELLDLLREARETMRNFAENWDCDTDAHKYRTTCRVCAAKEAQDRIDAALADALAELQDSAKDVVEWSDSDGWMQVSRAALPNRNLEVRRGRDAFKWKVIHQGCADTAEDAKAAAIAAAKGLR